MVMDDQRSSAVLRALALLDQAITAESDQTAADLIPPDIEAMDRDDLALLAKVLVIETPRRWVAPAHRLALATRILAARAELSWRRS